MRVSVSQTVRIVRNGGVNIDNDLYIQSNLQYKADTLGRLASINSPRNWPIFASAKLGTFWPWQVRDFV